MEPKYFRLVILRQDAIDSHLEILKRDTIQAVVAFIFGVEVFITGKEIGGDPFLEHGQETDTVPVVSDSTPVVDLSNHIPDGLPVDLFTYVVQEDLQRSKWHLQVWVIELVSYVEPEWTVLASLLD